MLSRAKVRIAWRGDGFQNVIGDIRFIGPERRGPMLERGKPHHMFAVALGVQIVVERDTRDLQHVDAGDAGMRRVADDALAVSRKASASSWLAAFRSIATITMGADARIAAAPLGLISSIGSGFSIRLTTFRQPSLLVFSARAVSRTL